MTLKTERLVLRPFSEADIPGVTAYLSDPDTTRFDSPLYSERERNEAARLRLNSESCLAICLADDGCVVGEVQCERGAYDVCRLGCIVSREHRGCGYAREAVERLMLHLFTVEGAERIEALTDTENLRAQRVLEAVGTQREGVMRHFCSRRGEDGSKDFRDIAIYAALRGEWLARDEHE